MFYLPEKVTEIVNEHINLMRIRLPEFLVAYYISGSISLGAFDYGNSDIDFIAVIQSKVTPTDIDVLKKIHREMHKKYHNTTLDGMYLRIDDFGSLRNEEVPCLRFNDGVFQGDKTFDKNSVDAFLLKKYGITIIGQDVEEFKYSVDFEILIKKMKCNLNTYWLQWVNACRRFPSMRYIGIFLSLKTIEWGVLGVSRQYYTFNERDITSKVGAGEYALRTVPQRWHKIIKESMRLRNNNDKSYYKSIFKRRKDALGYIDYIINENNKLLL